MPAASGASRPRSAPGRVRAPSLKEVRRVCLAQFTDREESRAQAHHRRQEKDARHPTQSHSDWHHCLSSEQKIKTEREHKSRNEGESRKNKRLTNDDAVNESGVVSERFQSGIFAHPVLHFTGEDLIKDDSTRDKCHEPARGEHDADRLHLQPLPSLWRGELWASHGGRDGPRMLFHLPGRRARGYSRRKFHEPGVRLIGRGSFENLDVRITAGDICCDSYVFGA